MEIIFSDWTKFLLTISKNVLPLPMRYLILQVILFIAIIASMLLLFGSIFACFFNPSGEIAVGVFVGSLMLLIAQVHLLGWASQKRGEFLGAHETK